MVILMDRVESNLNNPETQQSEQNMGVCDYEQSREERIKENLERMQKLGILDLSLKLKSSLKSSTPKRPSPRRTPKSQSHSHSVLPHSGPVRRSSRLQNSTPVSYCEVPLTKKDKSLEDGDLLREVGSKPEAYTEEHEKLLGSTEKSWTLFVDGYGKDGKRIYDPVRGKTCHQCRQKTLGHRTHCSTCNLVQGQFCGDCLYMRYGENVLEANENPDWICPVCRGICNCSLCRQAKGWPPTGTLYRKISSLGYKSVAHYLVQTRRADTNSDENVGKKVPISAKRSLPFSDTEVTPGKDDHSESNGKYLKSDPVSGVDATNDDTSDNITEETHAKEVIACREMAPETEAEPLHLPEPAVVSQSTAHVQKALETDTDIFGSAYDESKETNSLVDKKLEESKTGPQIDPLLTESSNQNESITPERGDDNDIKKNDVIMQDNENLVAPGKSPKPTKKCVSIASTPDSIAGRLRQRKNKCNASEELGYDDKFTGISEDITQTPDSTPGSSRQRGNNSKANEEPGSINSEYCSRIAENTASKEDVDDDSSISRRLKRRRMA